MYAFINFPIVVFSGCVGGQPWVWSLGHQHKHPKPYRSLISIRQHPPSDRRHHQPRHRTGGGQSPPTPLLPRSWHPPLVCWCSSLVLDLALNAHVTGSSVHTIQPQQQLQSVGVFGQQTTPRQEGRCCRCWISWIHDWVFIQLEEHQEGFFFLCIFLQICLGVCVWGRGGSVFCFLACLCSEIGCCTNILSLLTLNHELLL